MKIPVCHVADVGKKDDFRCPVCHQSQYRKHGFYTRKGLHAPHYTVAIPVKIQRYLCRNPQCPRRTFSILPDNLLRYCRFFRPYLLSLNRARCEGATVYHLARHVWHVGRSVITRAVSLLTSFERWVSGQHQELTNGSGDKGLEAMLAYVTDAIGRFELETRWYRHRYPLRFQ